MRVDAGMAFGVVNTPEYRAMNPNGRVPTIDYDGFILWESNTIVRYLYAKHGPIRTFEEGYGAEKWMDWVTSTLAAPITTIFWQLIRTPADKRDGAAVEAAVKQAGDIFKIADDVLASQPYMSGRELLHGRHPVRLLREPLDEAADPAPGPREPRPLLRAAEVPPGVPRST